MRTSLRAAVGAALLTATTAACIAPGGDDPEAGYYQVEAEQDGQRTNDDGAGAEVFLANGLLRGVKGSLPHNDGIDPDVDTWRVVVPGDGPLYVECTMNTSGAVSVEVSTGLGDPLGTLDCGDREDGTFESPDGAYRLRVITYTGGARSTYEIDVAPATS